LAKKTRKRRKRKKSPFLRKSRKSLPTRTSRKVLFLRKKLQPMVKHQLKARLRTLRLKRHNQLLKRRRKRKKILSFHLRRGK